MKENSKILFWIIFATTAGIILGHTLFQKVEPGWGMRDTSEIENYEKIKEFQFSCVRGDTTEYYANIAYIGNETDLAKAIHEFRIYLLNKSLGTYEDELLNIHILRQTIESYNVIPVCINAGVGRCEDYEQLKKKI